MTIACSIHLLLLQKRLLLLHPALILLVHHILLLLNQLLLISHLFSRCWSCLCTLGSESVCLSVRCHLFIINLHVVLNLLCLETAIHSVNVFICDVFILLGIIVELLTKGLRILVYLCLATIAFESVIFFHFHLHSIEVLLRCFTFALHLFSVFKITLGVIYAVIVF